MTKPVSASGCSSTASTSILHPRVLDRGCRAVQSLDRPGAGSGVPPGPRSRPGAIQHGRVARGLSRVEGRAGACRDCGAGARAARRNGSRLRPGPVPEVPCDADPSARIGHLHHIERATLHFDRSGHSPSPRAVESLDFLRLAAVGTNDAFLMARTRRPQSPGSVVGSEDRTRQL